MRVTNKENICIICSKIFTTTAGYLIIHRERHLNPDSFECELCEKTFTMKSNLKLHSSKYHSNAHKSSAPQDFDLCQNHFSKVLSEDRHAYLVFNSLIE